MAARRKRRQPAALRRYWARHRKNSPPRRRRRARRNPFTASGVIANPHRRRARRNYTFMGNRKRRRARRNYSFVPNRRRRHAYRRNPSLLGFTFPPVMDIAALGAGFVIPPVVMRYLMPMLPTDMQASRPVQYGVKIASIILPSWAVKKFVSVRAGNLMMLGGFASLAIDLLKDTGVLAQLGLSGATGQPMLGFYPRLSRAGGLGRYTSIPAASSNVTSSRMLQNVPDRLNPQSRF